MNIAHWLYQTARARPRAAAVKVGTTLFCDYATLARRAQALSRQLGAQGVGAGDRVALFAANCPEYLEILHACWWLGATVVPINYKLHPREAAWIIEDCGARLVLTRAAEMGAAGLLPAGCAEIAIDSGLYRQAAAATDDLSAPPSLDAGAVAWLFYTSGTTGRPKGVMLSHTNLLAMSMAYTMDVDHIVPGDHSLYAAPMSHGAGLYALPFIRAGAAHVIPASGGFDPAEIIALAGSLGGLCFFAAPTMIKRLVTAAKALDYRGEGIRTIVYGGGPMYGADIDEALAQFGPRFVQIYGQGETPMTITALPRDLVADETHPDWRGRRDSVGFAQAPVEVRILGDDGAPLPAGQTGEIAVRGATVMLGYWNRPEATAETIVDGWLHTGDLGRLDADGFLTLTDRSKDVIISGGTNIYPREVEEALLLHPAVHEVSVIGTPDPEWGETVVAFVVAAPGAACDQPMLDDWCRSQIAAFKRPKRYVFTDTLPKNSYGKVLKTELRQQLAPARQAPGDHVSQREETI